MKPAQAQTAAHPLSTEIDRLRREVADLKRRVAELTAPPTADEEVWMRLHRQGPGLAVLELRTRGDKIVARRTRKEHDIAEVSMGRAHQWLLQDAEPERAWSDRAPP